MPAFIIAVSFYCPVAVPDTVNCSDYRLPEWRAICSRYAQSDIDIHQSLAPDGLNDLVDSLGEKSGLQIIPAKTYKLQKAVILKNQQALLPLITSSNELQLIGLRIADDFTVEAGKSFVFIKLQGEGAAGGLNLDGTSLPDSLPGAGESPTLADLSADIAVELAGSVLRGDRTGKLKQLVRVSGSLNSSGASGGAALRGNFISPGSVKVGVRNLLADSQKLELTNNRIGIDNYQATGVVSEGGVIKLQYNDFVFSNRCYSSFDCHGLEMRNTPSFVVTDNAFWVGESNKAMGLFLHIVDSSVTSQGEYTGNVFSPGIEVYNFQQDQSDGDYYTENVRVVTARNYKNVQGAYPWTTPERFFAYIGTRGALPVSVQALMGVSNLIPSADNLTNFTRLQRKISLAGNKALNIFSPGNVTGQCDEGCSQCAESCSRNESGFSYGGGIPMIIMMCLYPLVSIVNSILSYKWGRMHRHPSGFQPVSVQTVQ
ncbi:MAG: hypothetical protein ACR2PT_05125 [Endozoicomonas sp.]